MADIGSSTLADSGMITAKLVLWPCTTLIDQIKQDVYSGILESVSGVWKSGTVYSEVRQYGYKSWNGVNHWRNGIRQERVLRGRIMYKHEITLVKVQSLEQAVTAAEARATAAEQSAETATAAVEQAQLDYDTMLLDHEYRLTLMELLQEGGETV